MVKGSRPNKSRRARNKRSMSQRKRWQNEKLKLSGKLIDDEQRKANGETILPNLINIPIQLNKSAVDCTNANESLVKLEIIDSDEEMDKCQSQISQTTTSTNLNIPVKTVNNQTYSATKICQSTQPARTDYRDVVCKKSTVELPYYVTSKENSADSATDNCIPTQPAKTHYHTAKARINMPVVCKKSTIALPNYVASMENWLSTSMTQVISPANLMCEEIVDNQYKECYYRYCSPNFMNCDFGSTSTGLTNDEFSYSSSRCDVPLATYQKRTKYQKRNWQYFKTKCEESEDKQQSALYKSRETYMKRRWKKLQLAKHNNVEVTKLNTLTSHHSTSNASSLLNTPATHSSLPSSVETEQRCFKKDYYSGCATNCSQELTSVSHADSTAGVSLDTLGDQVRIKEEVCEEPEETITDVIGTPVVTSVSRAGSSLDVPSDKFEKQVQVKEEVCEEPEENQISALYRSVKTYAQRRHGIKQSRQQSKLTNSEVTKTNMRILRSNAPKASILLNTVTRKSIRLSNSLRSSEAEQRKFNEDYYSGPATFLGCNIEDVKAGGNINVSTSVGHAGFHLDNSLVTSGDKVKIKEEVFEESEDAEAGDNTNVSAIVGHTGFHLDNSLVTSGDKVKIKEEVFEEPENDHPNPQHGPMDTYDLAQKHKPHQLASVNPVAIEPNTRISCRNISGYSTESVPPLSVRRKEFVQGVKSELRDSPVTMDISSDAVPKNHLMPHVTRILRNPTTQWNSCSSAVTTQTVTTFASTANKPMCTSTSTLGKICLTSTVATQNSKNTTLSKSAQMQHPIASMSSLIKLPSSVTVTAVPPLGKHVTANKLSVIESPSTITVIANPSSSKQLKTNKVPPLNSSPTVRVITIPAEKPLLANMSSALNLPSVVISAVPSSGKRSMENSNLSIDLQPTSTVVTASSSGKQNVTNLFSAATVTSMPSSIKILKVNTVSSLNSASVATVTLPSSGEQTVASKDSSLNASSPVTVVKVPTSRKHSLLNLPPNVTVVKLPPMKMPLTANVGPSTESPPTSTVTATPSAAHVPYIMTERKAHQSLDGRYIADSSPKTYSKTRSYTVSQKPQLEPTSENRVTTPCSEMTTRSDKSLEAIKTSAFPKEVSDYILSERVARQLKNYLPDTSFVRYLADPDFYFFVSLMPVVQLLSRQQRLKARAKIREVIYELA